MGQNYNIDVATGLSFLLSQLTFLETKMYEKKYKSINYQDIVPISNEAGEWAESITYFYMDGAAIAEFVGTKSLDVPIAEIGSKAITILVELGATGYEYSDEELRQAIQLQRPLPQLKLNTARRAYEELVQRTAMVGDATHNLPGFINNANVMTETVAAGGKGKTEWDKKTSNEILFDINNLMGGVLVDTLQVERPNTLLLPTAKWNYIAGTPRSDNSDTTMLQWLVSNSPFLTSDADIIPVSELTGAGVGNANRMMTYDKDIDKVVMHIPMPLRFTEPQRKGRGFQIPGEFKIGGVEFRYPGSARYGDGI